MIAALAMMACPNLAIPPRLMVHVAMVESRANPFAIGVVGGRLARPPTDLAEAVATARMLEASGYNFSVGIAQVNRANLARYDLDTYEQAFDVCSNLRAASQILARCYEGANGAWDKAFSCYYSGDHVTGFRDGYVQKIFASLGRDAGVGVGAPGAAPIAVRPGPDSRVSRGATHAPSASGRPARRVAIRSVALDRSANTPNAPAAASAVDPAAASAVDPAAGSMAVAPAPVGPEGPATARSAGPASAAATAAMDTAEPGQPAALPPPGTTGSADGIFVPRVSGPGEARDVAPAGGRTNPSTATADPADLRHGSRDQAFVF